MSTRRHHRRRVRQEHLRPLTYLEHREATKRDLLAKFWREDWHGVIDAGIDLEKQDAQHEGYIIGYADGIIDKTSAG